MVPVSLRTRSPSLANRLLLLSSVHHLQDGRLVVAVTRQCHGSWDGRRRPRFLSARWQCDCTRSSYPQHRRQTLVLILCVPRFPTEENHAGHRRWFPWSRVRLFPVWTHIWLPAPFVQVRFLGNVVLHRLLIQTRGTVKETFVVFGHVLLQVSSETESNALQQLSGAVLQLQHTDMRSSKPISLCGEPFGNCCKSFGPIVNLRSLGTAWVKISTSSSKRSRVFAWPSHSAT